MFFFISNPSRNSGCSTLRDFFSLASLPMMPGRKLIQISTAWSKFPDTFLKTVSKKKIFFSGSSGSSGSSAENSAIQNLIRNNIYMHLSLWIPPLQRRKNSMGFNSLHLSVGHYLLTTLSPHWLRYRITGWIYSNANVKYEYKNTTFNNQYIFLLQRCLNKVFHSKFCSVSKHSRLDWIVEA
jgi:hypothetical protein